MAVKNDGEGPLVWNISDAQWTALVRQVNSSADMLDDGAYVRVEAGQESETAEMSFYATALNRPAGFAYPFLEAVPGSRALGASVGRAWYEAATGFVQFEVTLYAAAQALAAEYESGTSDLDFVTYEQAVEQAVRGTSADAAWLYREFARLMNVVRL